jgi:hypothetical protein
MKNLKRNLIGVWILFAGLTGTIYADKEITKSFEFGPGTQFSSSNFRTFPVPCGVKVKAFVMFQRFGPSGSDHDVNIVIELHSPGTSADDEGPQVAMQEATAKVWVGIGIPSTTTLYGEKNNRGCNLPWIVRVRTKSGQSPVQVSGTIRVSYDGGYGVSTGSSFSLNNGDTRTINFGTSNGLTQGRLTIRGEWYHNLGVMPIRMKVELIDPDGNVVDSKTAYSAVEINPCCSGTKMQFTVTIPECKSGQWKLRIKNLSDHDAVRVGFYNDLQTSCP